VVSTRRCGHGAGKGDHLAIDPSRPEQRRIDQLGPIRSREYEDPLERFHTCGEQKGTRGAVVSACMQTPSSASTHRPGHRGAD
jgi:hypothetical protein